MFDQYEKARRYANSLRRKFKSYVEANSPKNMGLAQALRNSGKVVDDGLLNPNEYNAPAANRFKDSAFGLLGGIPGADAPVGFTQGADYFNRGEPLAGSVSVASGILPFIPAIGGMFIGKGAKTWDVLKAQQAEELLAKGMVKQGSKVSDALTQEQKAAAVNMEPGWFRGGPEPKDGKRTGPMYTRDASEAEGYAKRFDQGDMREYAIPQGPYLNAESSYSPKLAQDMAKILDDPYYGKPGQQLAKELRTFGPDERITGGSLWQALESRYGNDGAAEVLDRLGHFKGAKGFSAPGEVYVFKSAPVRDAKKAKFDPARLHKDDIYGRATIPAMLTTGGLSLGAMGLLGRNQRDDEERKQ